MNEEALLQNLHQRDDLITALRLKIINFEQKETMLNQIIQEYKNNKICLEDKINQMMIKIENIIKCVKE